MRPCRACDNQAAPNSDLCGQCAWLKFALAEKRLKVPHKPIGAMAWIGMIVLAGFVVGLGFFCAAVMGVGAYR